MYGFCLAPLTLNPLLIVGSTAYQGDGQCRLPTLPATQPEGVGRGPKSGTLSEC